MANWTVCFDATVSVKVEAETAEEAERKASEIFDERAATVEETSLGCVYLIVNNETSEEILK